MGGEHHHLPLQGQRRWAWVGKLSRSQIARPGHEGSREGDWECASMTCSLASYLDAAPQKRHIHYRPVTRKVPCHQKDIVHGLCWSGKSVRLFAQTHHPVGSSQARRQGMAGAAHTEHVWNAISRVRVGCNLIEEFSVKVGSGRSPLLFIPVLEALNEEFGTRCPWENRYADDLVIITESLEKLQEKMVLWKTNMEGKGLQVNMAKPRSWYLGRGSMCFRSPTKTPVARASRVSLQTPFSVMKLGSQEMQWFPWP